MSIPSGDQRAPVNSFRDAPILCVSFHVSKPKIAVATKDVGSVRHSLYQAFLDLRDLEDAERVVAYQLRLADAIAEAESVSLESGQFDRHCFLLRRCQDALAFRLLDPHALKQLLGSASPRAHSLSGQGEAFRATRKAAERYAADGHSVLLADLSHIIRVGDLIVCDNPFIPSIIEVKSGEVAPQHVMQGRRGRQVSRSLTTIEYLKRDRGQIFGQSSSKIAVQSNESMDFKWDAVDDVTLAALREKTAVIQISDYDVLLALHSPDGDSILLEPIAEDLLRFRSPLIASHAVSLLNPELLTRPPLAWPINDESKPLLMEEELILVHAIDLARFRDPLEEDFRILEVSHDHGFSIERGGERGTASRRFINEVMFGYATIESVVAGLRELHDLTKTALESRAQGEPTQPDPKAIVVESLELALLDQPAVVMETNGARYRIDWQAPQ